VAGLAPRSSLALRPRLAAGVPLLAVRLDDLPCFVRCRPGLEHRSGSVRSNFRWQGECTKDRAPRARSPVSSCGACGYLTSSKILKIGMYIATIIDPTIAPRPAIISGSMRAVSDSVVASTSWS
jgi:hypothetical protein